MELCKSFVKLNVEIEKERELSIDALMNDDRRKVFLEGEPGAGKSTVCNYISQMWSLAREPFSRFDLVARIDLRDLSACEVISPSSIAKRILERSKKSVNKEQLIVSLKIVFMMKHSMFFGYSIHWMRQNKSMVEQMISMSLFLVECLALHG